MLYIILVTIMGLALLAAGLGWWGVRRTFRQFHESQTTLERVAQGIVWQPEDMQGLPAPVARYLGRALPPAGGPLRLARAKMNGGIRLNPNGPWQKWTGRQVWCLRPPAFVWSARMSAKPLLPVYVRDGLIKGEGGLLVRLWGWLTMARATASPELDQGSLERWLAEAPLFPPALLPGPTLAWRGEGDGEATAVLNDAGRRVEARFGFDERGLPATCRVEQRPRQQPDGSFAPTPWLARYDGWRKQGGMLLPTRCEAVWLLEGEEFCYLRLSIEQADFF